MKIKLNFFNKFIFGGVILILLSKMDFFSFNGKIGVLVMAIIFIFYFLLNLLPMCIYLFEKELKIYTYIKISIIVFLFLISLFFLFVDPEKYLILKIGIIIRVFLSYFPLLLFSFFYNKL